MSNRMQQLIPLLSEVRQSVSLVFAEVNLRIESQFSMARSVLFHFFSKALTLRELSCKCTALLINAVVRESGGH